MLQHPTQPLSPRLNLRILRVIPPRRIRHLLRHIKRRQLGQKAPKTRLLVLPIDTRPQAHQKARQLSQRGRVPPDQQRQAQQRALGTDVEREILAEHVPALDEAVLDARRHGRPIHAFVRGAVLRRGDGDEVDEGERRGEADGAEVGEVGEAELVEVLVAEEGVVDEEELDAALDGGDAAAVVDDADVGVGGEGFGEGGVHGGADGGAEFFDGCEAAVRACAVGVGVLGVVGGEGGVLRVACLIAAGGEHGCYFADFGVGADEIVLVGLGGGGVWRSASGAWCC